MLFWHLGMTAAIVFLTLGRRIDYRVVLLGAILPDLIDKPIGRIFFEERFESGRLFGHSLLFVVVLILAIQVGLRGASARRWFILPVGAGIHLGLDAMWNHPVTLFWPLFTTRFPRFPVENYWLEVLSRPDIGSAVMEVVGLGLLLYLAYAFELERPGPRREFLRTGRLGGSRAGRARSE